MIRSITSLLTDTRGNAALLTAFGMVAMLGFVGLAVDGFTALLLKDRLQDASDAAAFAGAKVMIQGDPAVDGRRLFDANFGTGYIGASVTGVSIAVGADDTVRVDAAAEFPTQFMHFLGQSTLTVHAHSGVLRTNRSAEIALVMDNTGSMRSGSKIDAMKAAARDLVGILFGEDQSREDLWVSVVPYTAMVNIGNGRTDWLGSGDRVFVDPGSFGTTVWKGCVAARADGHDKDDATPASSPFSSFIWPAAVDNVWPQIDERNEAENNGTGPNLGCGPAITPLTRDRATIEAAIAEMLPWHRGGTLGNLGLVWGWRTISPRWTGLWGDGELASLPTTYDNPLIDKIVVMMTDGENQFYDWPSHQPNNGVGPSGSDKTAYGRMHEFMPGASRSQARAEIDRRFAATCQDMKDLGIELFTITFGSAPDSGTQALYRSCATDGDHYFHSPTNEMLATAFRSIGQKLSSLRLIE
ncbi:pilus assembly protein TadG-related protein [Thalassobaculum sp.]|uniref:pilus assembly protein TadG-related protein n=1 Tax=Thalassobaculum sp. TaxID=2022740 RepID=UPI0032EBCAA7